VGCRLKIVSSYVKKSIIHKQFRAHYPLLFGFDSALSQPIEWLFERKIRKGNVRDWRALIEEKSMACAIIS
jgi:hypothetical protein